MGAEATRRSGSVENRRQHNKSDGITVDEPPMLLTAERYSKIDFWNLSEACRTLRSNLLTSVPEPRPPLNTKASKFIFSTIHHGPVDLQNLAFVGRSHKLRPPYVARDL